ncbi:hypothetical protein K438DRAFT_2048699 [Mycena galopus ATCC 62051]|nr:hypothetical protein K438DRAFT_2048699 [Mycena galopus ATCC 62051]
MWTVLPAAASTTQLQQFANNAGFFKRMLKDSDAERSCFAGSSVLPVSWASLWRLQSEKSRSSAGDENSARREHRAARFGASWYRALCGRNLNGLYIASKVIVKSCVDGTCFGLGGVSSGTAVRVSPDRTMIVAHESIASLWLNRNFNAIRFGRVGIKANVAGTQWKGAAGHSDKCRCALNELVVKVGPGVRPNSRAIVVSANDQRWAEEAAVGRRKYQKVGGKKKPELVFITRTTGIWLEHHIGWPLFTVRWWQCKPVPAKGNLNPPLLLPHSKHSLLQTELPALLALSSFIQIAIEDSGILGAVKLIEMCDDLEAELRPIPLNLRASRQQQSPTSEETLYLIPSTVLSHLGHSRRRPTLKSAGVTLASSTQGHLLPHNKSPRASRWLRQFRATSYFRTKLDLILSIVRSRLSYSCRHPALESAGIAGHLLPQNKSVGVPSGIADLMPPGVKNQHRLKLPAPSLVNHSPPIFLPRISCATHHLLSTPLTPTALEHSSRSGPRLAALLAARTLQHDGSLHAPFLAAHAASIPRAPQPLSAVYRPLRLKHAPAMLHGTPSRPPASAAWAMAIPHHQHRLFRLFACQARLQQAGLYPSACAFPFISNTTHTTPDVLSTWGSRSLSPDACSVRDVGGWPLPAPTQLMFGEDAVHMGAWM